jgi:hypothetical protein
MQSQISEPNSDPLGNRFLRLLMFMVTFMLVPFLAWSPRSFSEYSLILLFPAGLLAFLVRNTDALSSWSIAIGWGIYVGISLIALFVKKRSLFVVLYIIFLLFLFMNVAGCNLINVKF